MGLLDALIAPALTADSDIALIASDLYLLPLGDDASVAVDPRIDDGLAPAVARRLHLLYRIGDLEKTARPFEEASLEVGAETIAHDVASIVVHYLGKLIHLIFRQELSLIHKHPVGHGEGLLENILHHLVEVGLRIDPLALTLYADTGADHVFLLSRVYDRLEAHIGHAALLEVICCSEQHGGLCRPHGAIAKI